MAISYHSVEGTFKSERNSKLNCTQVSSSTHHPVSTKEKEM